MTELHIGTSGYQYRDWRGILYPAGLPQRQWLSCYAATFRTVEINSTFYGVPAAATVARWAASVPEGFVFSVKLHRFGTHLKRLRDPDTWLARSLDPVAPLGSALGPILIQLPPRWRRDTERLARLLDMAPSGHRYAVELRDRDWLHPSTYQILREHGAALCLHDLIADHPRHLTTDWVYLRFHGPDPSRPYSGGYPPPALRGAAQRIRRYLADGRDVYAYFNNDGAGHAVRDAQTLRRFLGDVR